MFNIKESPLSHIPKAPLWLGTKKGYRPSSLMS